MSDEDGTNNLQYHYEINFNEEAQEILGEIIT